MNTRIALIYGLFLASAFCLLAATQTDQRKATGKKPWPKNRTEVEAVNGAKDAFTAALTRSGYDRDFRNRLTASCDSAKEAVKEEGNIDIPNDVLIMFFEPDTYQKHFGFYLPPFGQEPQEYWRYHQCCFPKFRLLQLAAKRQAPKTAARQPWTRETAAVAFTATLERAAHDSKFRDDLITSCDSAKKAISDEGNVEIPEDVRMMFHKDEFNEKYHVFSLPLFDPNARTPHQYSDNFMGLYNEW
jgi:hypothetical protein